MNTLRELIDRKYALTRTLLSKKFDDMSEVEVRAELKYVNTKIEEIRMSGERNYSIETINAKYRLTSALLSKKLTEEEQIEVRSNLSLLNSLRTRVKSNLNIEYEESFNRIQECASRVK